MKFSCMHDGSRFLVARPDGHEWYANEKSEFTEVKIDLAPMPNDYEVELASGVVAMASGIDCSLVEGAA